MCRGASQDDAAAAQVAGEHIRCLAEGNPTFLVFDATRNVDPGTARRDDGMAIFEEEPVCHRKGFAALGMPGHLDEEMLPNRHPFRIAEKTRAIRCLHKHTAHPFYGTHRLGTVDGAGSRGVCVEDEILKSSVDDQSCRVATLNRAIGMKHTFHAAAPHLYPAALSSLAVSWTGSPMIAV